jgi:GNAT superfamily N-acetyltransferase
MTKDSRRGDPLSDDQEQPGFGLRRAGRDSVMSYTVRPLDASTWDAFAELVERNNGIYGGCWCQYGSPDELDLRHGREYRKDPPPPARWRITCLFVDRRHRGQGIARAGLEGALAQIAAAGGGLVEAISETTTGREAQSRFLFSATVELFEDYGFERGRQVGKHAWIVSRDIDPA